MKKFNQSFWLLFILVIGNACVQQNQSSDCSICEDLAAKQTQAWNDRDMNLLKSTLHPEHQNIYGGNTIKGADAQIDNVSNILSAQSNLKTNMQVAFCDAKHCAVYWTASGHDTALSVDWELTGQAIWTLENGLIIIDKGENDMLGAYVRNGFTLQPPNSESKEVEAQAQDK